MPVWLFAAVVVAVLAGAGIGSSYGLRGDVSVSYCVLSLFLALNLLISYWELSLGVRQDLIAARAAYWRGRRAETGRSPPCLHPVDRRRQLQRPVGTWTSASAFRQVRGLDAGREARVP